jgi:hypothetical protein
MMNEGFRDKAPRREIRRKWANSLGISILWGHRPGCRNLSRCRTILSAFFSPILSAAKGSQEASIFTRVIGARSGVVLGARIAAEAMIGARSGVVLGARIAADSRNSVVADVVGGMTGARIAADSRNSVVADVVGGMTGAMAAILFVILSFTTAHAETPPATTKTPTASTPPAIFLLSKKSQLLLAEPLRTAVEKILFVTSQKISPQLHETHPTPFQIAIASWEPRLHELKSCTDLANTLVETAPPPSNRLTLNLKLLKLLEVTASQLSQSTKSTQAPQPSQPTRESSTPLPDSWVTKNCAYRTLEDLLQGSLVRAVAQHYDDQGLTHDELLSLRRNCQGRIDPEWLDQCWYLKTRTKRVSDTHAYLHLARWSGSFAENIEQMTFDPQYRCRRPALFEFLKQQFPAPTPTATSTPSPRSTPTLLTTNQPVEDNVNCAGRFQIQDPVSEDSITIRPEDVLEVHYLYAGQGTTQMTANGHSMIRLVICDLELSKTKTVEVCRKHLRTNLVISYQFVVPELSHSNWKSLTGGYLSQIFIDPMQRDQPQQDVIKRYTQKQNRDLVSLPLKMNREQIHRLVETVIDQYWSYQTPYKFLSQNCATEAFELLKAAYLDPKLSLQSAISPAGVFTSLLESDLADLSFWPQEKKKTTNWFDLLLKKGSASLPEEAQASVRRRSILFMARGASNLEAQRQLAETLHLTTGIEITSAELFKTTAKKRAEWATTLAERNETRALHGLLALENEILARTENAIETQAVHYALKNRTNTHAQALESSRYKMISLMGRRGRTDAHSKLNSISGTEVNVDFLNDSSYSDAQQDYEAAKYELALLANPQLIEDLKNSRQNVEQFEKLIRIQLQTELPALQQ